MTKLKSSSFPGEQKHLFMNFKQIQRFATFLVRGTRAYGFNTSLYWTYNSPWWYSGVSSVSDPSWMPKSKSESCQQKFKKKKNTSMIQLTKNYIKNPKPISKKVSRILPWKRFLLKESVLRTSEDPLLLLPSLIASFSYSIEEPSPENLHSSSIWHKFNRHYRIICDHSWKSYT